MKNDKFGPVTDKFGKLMANVEIKIGQFEHDWSP